MGWINDCKYCIKVIIIAIRHHSTNSLWRRMGRQLLYKVRQGKQLFVAAICVMVLLLILIIISLPKGYHITGNSYIDGNSQDNPIPAKNFLLPWAIWYQCFCKRDSISTASATNTLLWQPARSVALKGLKNSVMVVAGGLFCPIERLNISTPSWTAW